MFNELVLKINGESYTGWKSVYVNKSLTEIAGVFGLSTFDRNLDNSLLNNIAMGDECTVEINNQILLTGYVEDMPELYDAYTHTIEMNGRDNTCDLVDCCYALEGAEWFNQTIENLIKKIITPFSDLSVAVDLTAAIQAAKKIKKFKIEQGETIFESIMRVCKQAAILPVCYGDSKITLTMAGNNRAYDVLELGKNIKAGARQHTDRDRFSTYIVKGNGVGDDDKELADYTHCIGAHTDEVIRRDRPLIILSDRSTDNGMCRDEARWTANIRAGQSRSFTYTVNGWTQSNGDVWFLNSLVNVKDDKLNVNSTMLISALEFILDPESEGTKTNITVVHPDTYTLLAEPIKEIKTKKDWRSGLQ